MVVVLHLRTHGKEVGLAKRSGSYKHEKRQKELKKQKKKQEKLARRHGRSGRDTGDDATDTEPGAAPPADRWQDD